MIPQEWIDQAVEQLDGRVRRTPLTYDTENDWYLKWENHQVTGSFKSAGSHPQSAFFGTVGAPPPGW